MFSKKRLISGTFGWIALFGTYRCILISALLSIPYIVSSTNHIFVFIHQMAVLLQRRRVTTAAWPIRQWRDYYAAPSSVGGCRILRCTLSVRLSVRPSRARKYFCYPCGCAVSFVIVYITTVFRATHPTSVFDYRPASTLRMCGIFCFVYICGAAYCNGD